MTQNKIKQNRTLSKIGQGLSPAAGPWQVACLPPGCRESGGRRRGTQVWFPELSLEGGEGKLTHIFVYVTTGLLGN